MHPSCVVQSGMPKIWTSQDSQGTTFQSRRSGLCASGAKWLPGVITTVRGSQSYDITLEDGQITRHHVDHTREHSDSTSAEPTDIWLPDSIESSDSPTSTTPERTTPDDVPV